jgi:hypothetical protein
VTLLLVLAAALLGLGLFFAGAAWRARVTSHTQKREGTSRQAAKLAKIDYSDCAFLRLCVRDSLRECQSFAATSRVFSSHLPLTRSIVSKLWPAATIRGGIS